MYVYNTLTRKKEELVPLVPGEIKMYACGPTVYDFFHIGNARPFIIFDTLRRYLEYRGYKVTFVQNFTDIDDKMIKRANEDGITVKELGERFIGEYYKDAEALGIKKATVHPKAPEHIPEIIDMIKTLIDKGYAYESNGDVYFSTHAFPEYGKLSGQPMDNLEAGARISPGESKRDPMDFALWKAAKPGEPHWPSPWGEGRPGWHIECSAMSMKYLGETIDIHGGGYDLIFPHHENEMAQSEGATGRPFVHYWLHNGYITIDKVKMSKSLGNFFTVRDIAKEFDLEVVRLFMLSAQYRNPINFSRELIEAAQTGLERMKNARARLDGLGADTASDAEVIAAVDGFKQSFIEAMDDDLNTADAVAALFELTRYCNASLSEASAKQDVAHAAQVFDELAGVLGLKIKKAEDEFSPQMVELAEKRQQARMDKNYKLADELRAQLDELGVIVEDSPQGFKLKRK
jgi:cysteinyl-tRNA synthetase